MTSVTSTPWFYWALAVAVGLPIAMVLLTELQHALTRRGSALTRPMGLLRNYILPLAALLVLLVKAGEISVDATPVRVLATALCVVVLMLVLSGLSATLFYSAPEGTWRKRIPTIFVDVARFAVIAVGVALIFAYIWGAHVGGLFTALGVSSVVLGLTLQHSVGQIVSGLFVLFEQPFRIGDWVDTPSARGRVVEVNWRATHIDTGGGLQIMPNSVLATASFTNLSRPPGAHSVTVVTVFSAGDAPDEVCVTLSRVASLLPQVRPDAAALTVPAGGCEYKTTIPLRSPADDGTAKATFLRWAWYASRRAGLHLDRARDGFGTPERRAQALRVAAPIVRLSDAEVQSLVPLVRLSRYGADEPLQLPGEVPACVTFIVAGQVRLVAHGEDGAVIPVRTLDVGEFLGQTALTRQPSMGSAWAVGEVTVLEINREQMEDLVARKPFLLEDFGRSIEERRTKVRRVLARAAKS